MERWRKRYSPSCHQELHVANNDASSRASTRTSNKGYRRALVLREHLHPLRASISICIVYVCACEVLMPFEVKRKCSIPRVSLFLPPHRINIGSLSCRCIRIPCDEAARDAISSIVPRRRDIARRSEEGKTVAGHADPRISLDLDRRERGIVYDISFI